MYFIVSFLAFIVLLPCLIGSLSCFVVSLMAFGYLLWCHLLFDGSSTDK